MYINLSETSKLNYQILSEVDFKQPLGGMIRKERSEQADV